jgi:hypothetical protein
MFKQRSGITDYDVQSAVYNVKSSIKSAYNQKKFATGFGKHFFCNCTITDQSGYWFFCWVRAEIHKGNYHLCNIWDKIYTRPYNAYNEQEFYIIAKKRRYSKCKHGGNGT